MGSTKAALYKEHNDKTINLSQEVKVDTVLGEYDEVSGNLIFKVSKRGHLMITSDGVSLSYPIAGIEIPKLIKWLQETFINEIK